MRKIGKIIGCCLIAVSLLACTACSGLDRLDLLEKIRQQGLKTPFLLMSGDNSRALEQKAKLYYGDFCCKTDFDLVEKIKALVNN